MIKNKGIKLLLSLVICLGAEFLGGILVSSSVTTWYVSLAKSNLTPPGWVFSVVWALLYLMMAFALWLVWIAPKRARTALTFFSVQLLLNVTWSWAFFFLQNPLLGLVNILLLWFFIGLTILSFYRVCKWAGIFLMPYWIWVTFATYLNAAIVVLNR